MSFLSSVCCRNFTDTLWKSPYRKHSVCVKLKVNGDSNSWNVNFISHKKSCRFCSDTNWAIIDHVTDLHKGVINKSQFHSRGVPNGYGPEKRYKDWTEKGKKSKKKSVRSGIRTHAYIRRPEHPTECKICSWVWRLRPLGHPDTTREQWQKMPYICMRTQRRHSPLRMLRCYCSD